MFCKCSFILIAPLASLAALARSLRSPCQCEAIFVRLAMILGRLGASGASGMPQKTAQDVQEASKAPPRLLTPGVTLGVCLPLSDSEDLLVIPWLLLPRCCSFCVSCGLQVQFHPDRSARFARCARSLAALALPM